MKRCFIALDIPENVKEGVESCLVKFAREVNRVANVKFVKKENMHITLKFLGSITDKTVEEVHEELKAMFPSKREISCELHAKFGVFPNEKYVRVVWVGVDSRGKIEDLMREVDMKMSKLGFGREKGYVPHITVARVKSVTDKDKLREIIKEVKIPKLRFTVNDASLYESVLKHDGPVYVKLHGYKLGGVGQRES